MTTGLQRSSISFRRQGSSGFVWDDKFLAAEINRQEEEKAAAAAAAASASREEAPQVEKTSVAADKNPSPAPAPGLQIEIKRNRSDGEGRGFRTGKVPAAIEPPSPKVSACGLCSAFGKGEGHRPRKSGKRVM